MEHIQEHFATRLTGFSLGIQSGMLSLVISESIFFLCPGFVTPIAVRSWR